MRAGVALLVLLALVGQDSQAELDIVPKGDWGKAKPATVDKVLHAAAGELWTYFPDRKLPRIESPTSSAPVRIAVLTATPSITPRFVRR